MRQFRPISRRGGGIAGGPDSFDSAGIVISQWLLALLGDLTDRQESARPHPWQVADAPGGYLAALYGLVGLETPINTLKSKWKVSQNWSATDRRGVARELANDGRDAAMAALVAATLNRPQQH